MDKMFSVKQPKHVISSTGSLQTTAAVDISLSDVRNLGPLSGGVSRVNDIYAGEYGELPVVVKFSNPTWDAVKVANERAALTYVARATNIPVPRVLGGGREILDVRQKPEERDYLVLAALPGTPWSTCSLDDRAYTRAVTQLATFVGELRKHTSLSFGNLSLSDDGELAVRSTFEIPGEPPPQISSFSDYLGFFSKAYLNKIQRMDPLLRQVELNFCEFRDKVMEAVARIGQGAESEPAVFFLSHQDFVKKNILVDPRTGDITGVLDWEWAGFTMPEMEKLSGCDFLRDASDKTQFAEIAGISCSFSSEREAGYKLLSSLYRMASCYEWQKEKVALTARFLEDKLMQREFSEMRMDPLDIFRNSLGAVWQQI